MLSYYSMAQQNNLPFKGYYYNNVHKIYIRADIHNQNMIIPAHEMLGELPGYLGKERNSFFWLITSAKIINNKKAELLFINDYGSEDFTAEFIQENDTTYILKHKEGSPLKVPENGRWKKLPKQIKLYKKH